MIRIENGELEVKGDIAKLFAELTSAFKGIAEGLLQDGYPKGLVERNVKGFIFLVNDVCKELDIDATLTDKDREDFERANNASTEMAEEVSKALMGLCDLLMSAHDDDDDTSETDDDIPDFLF